MPSYIEVSIVARAAMIARTANITTALRSNRRYLPAESSGQALSGYIAANSQEVIMGGSRKRATQNYRSRLSERGLARFEVLGRDADRDLIRSLARRLSEDTPEASELRATMSKSI